MPIDPETGEFVYDRQPMAGPGNIGPLGGLLQIMNASKGQDLASQIAGQRQLANMANVQRAGVGGVDYSTPEGQQALQGMGISPQTAQGLVQNAPVMKVKAALASYQQAHPGEAIPSQILEQAYIGAGMNPPAGLYSYLGREAGIQGAGDRAIMKNVQDAYSKIWGSQDVTDSEARRMAAGALTQIHPEYAARLNSWISMGTDQRSPMGEARRKSTEARGEEYGKLGELAAARAENIKQLTAPTVALRMAQAGLADAHRAATNTINELNQMREANGGVLPGVESDKEEQEFTRNVNALANLSKVYAMTPEQQQAFKDATAAIMEQRARLQAKAATARNPRAGLPGEFNSPQEVKAAVDSGAISMEEATRILQQSFGYK